MATNSNLIMLRQLSQLAARNSLLGFYALGIPKLVPLSAQVARLFGSRSHPQISQVALTKNPVVNEQSKIEKLQSDTHSEPPNEKPVSECEMVRSRFEKFHNHLSSLTDDVKNEFSILGQEIRASHKIIDDHAQRIIDYHAQLRGRRGVVTSILGSVSDVTRSIVDFFRPSGSRK